MAEGKWLAVLSVATCLAIPILFTIIVNRLGGNTQAGMSHVARVFFVGCISGAILGPLLVRILRRVATSVFSSEGSGGDLYGLDHGILNLQVPPVSMWMNMGFWEQKTSFPNACRALLEEVLIEATLLAPDRKPFAQSSASRLKIIDLGFGCGDQSLYLTQLAHEPQHIESLSIDKPDRFFLDSYIGLTVVPLQFCFASARLLSSSNISGDRVKLFCEDAANPASWSKAAQQAVANASTMEDDKGLVTTTDHQNTWILALDTLYHFLPSRQPIFKHACRELNASIMAFDLFISDTPSIWELALLRIVCSMAATPISNFLTVKEYRSQLVEAGYRSEDIVIRDISNRVFDGMATFIERQDHELKQNGMSIGKYKAAGKVFRWWARSGVVRGCIVVARK